MIGESSENVPAKKLSIKNIDTVLAYLPYFEDTKNVFFTTSDSWIDPFDFSPTVLDFIQTLHDESFIGLYDLSTWQDEAIKYYEDPALLDTADLETIRKLLTLHIRKDRFCGGHLADMIERGHILAILRRLKDIRDEIAEKQ
jgi:hypothetical protein